MQSPALPFSLEHLRQLTDDRGIIQHALFSIPNRKSGYTTDDNSRALIVVTRLYDHTGDRSLLRYVSTYLSFLLYVQRVDGRFRNFVGYNLGYLDTEGSDDCQGRACWASAVAAASTLPESMRHSARHMFDRLAGNFPHSGSPRYRAGVVRGLHILGNSHPSEEHRALLRSHADALQAAYRDVTAPGWRWFEESLTYGNAALPEALFRAYLVTGQAGYLQTARDSFDWLLEVLLSDGLLHPVGSDGWYPRGGARAAFDQQPEEAEAVVRCAEVAWEATGEQRYREAAEQAVHWFLGRNAHGLPVYDLSTGACCDGLTSEGVNRNQGAESTLAYLASCLTITHWGTAAAGTTA